MISNVVEGRTYPPGATPWRDGINFCVYSRNATAMELLFFDDVDDAEPSRIVTLDRKRHRTFHYWHVHVPGIESGQLYGYRAHGPYSPAHGQRFDGEKLLLDPYARAVCVGARYDREAAKRPGPNLGSAMKGVVVDPREYDWEGDVPLRRPFGTAVVYEMHVRGFTRHPSSGLPEDKRGTFAGLVEKIPYLKSLGVTTVELMPVFQFDEQDAPRGRMNYWGYSPVSFFAPHTAYSSDRSPMGAIHEFRDMVKALHRAGIEIILDVVYNHTAEGDEHGPTLSFRGLANDAYYILESDLSRYANLTGTGNTLNANYSIVRRLIRSSLEYWVTNMHVDGFRFDLASVLTRDEWGRPLESPPILWEIETDPVLAGTKLIAEAWDAGGLYQVGNFIGDQWKEWNGRFRDDVRRFVKGDRDTVAGLRWRLMGSPDLFGHEEREPDQCVNFVTCHDGFTLNDLVSYDRKHNEDNGEENRDGSDENHSYNWGVEGPSDDPAIEQLRARLIRNFFSILLLSVGTPLLSMGDEARRTQHGNNNPFCQDGPLTWFDWSLVERHSDLVRFVRELVRLRFALYGDALGDTDLSLNARLDRAHIGWHGVQIDQPDLGADSHSLAVLVRYDERSAVFYLAMNAYWEPLDFELPRVLDGARLLFRRAIDTALEPPNDIIDLSAAPAVPSTHYRVEPRSVVLLVAESMVERSRST